MLHKQHALIVAGLVFVVALGGCKPASVTTINKEASASASGIPADFKLANPCPPGVPSVYQRPDGAYVVRNGEDNQNFIVITQTPEEFCSSFQKATPNETPEVSSTPN